MEVTRILQTGQTSCHDAGGSKIDCAGSGQDAEYSRGIAWPVPRFKVGIDPGNGETANGDVAESHGHGGIVTDLLTGLVWTHNANPGEFPMDWAEAHDFVTRMNRDRKHGFDDWRLPDRRELRSLVSHQTRNPALPEGHPFTNVFMGWYWSATTAAVDDDFAWYVHMEGGRTFYGAKRQYYLVWPVQGAGNGVLQATGQNGDSPFGAKWPEPRFQFVANSDAVHDRLTGLIWRRLADLAGGPVLWQEALEAVRQLNAAKDDSSIVAEHSDLKDSQGENEDWRLPNINELESLVDMSRHDPALQVGHPFGQCQEVYWSSTTSMFEPDWAWALYLNKGAIGVGRKGYARFHVWAVKG